MITVKQYQEFSKIPSGSTEMELNKSIAQLIGLDLTKLTDEQVKVKIKDWLSNIVVSKLKTDHIRIGKKWYKVDRDLYTLAFSQWIYFDDTMRGANGKNTADILHFIIATFIRECRFYKFFPKHFNVNDIEKNAKLIQEKLDIRVALELTNFFFHYTLNSMKNSQVEYLERLERMVISDKTTD